MSTCIPSITLSDTFAAKSCSARWVLILTSLLIDQQYRSSNSNQSILLPFSGLCTRLHLAFVRDDALELKPFYLLRRERTSRLVAWHPRSAVVREFVEFFGTETEDDPD